jgi:hypothetical protein
MAIAVSVATGLAKKLRRGGASGLLGDGLGHDRVEWPSEVTASPQRKSRPRPWSSHSSVPARTNIACGGPKTGQ